MQKIKLFALLATFDKTDWKEGHKYLLGQTNEGTDIERLYDYCKKQKAQLNDPNFDVTHISEKLLTQNSTKSIQNAFSTLHKMMERYLIIQSMDQEEGLKDYLLSKEYNRRGQFQWATSIYEKSSKTKNKLSLEDSLYRWLIHHYTLFSNNPIKYDKAESMIHDGIKFLQEIQHEYSKVYEFEAINRGIVTDENYDELIATIHTNVESYPKNETTDLLNHLHCNRDFDEEVYGHEQ